MRVIREERGLAGTVLIIVIAWALAAVLMLTGTLIAAQQIDESVAEITSSVSEIDRDTDTVNVLFETRRIAKGIREAAAPVSPGLDRVVREVRGIDETVPRILSTAQQINSVVKQIGTTAGGIGGTVRSIHGNVSAILGVVRSIDGGGAGSFSGVAGINNRVDIILALVRGINSDLDAVAANVRRIRGSARSIDDKLPEALRGLGVLGGGPGAGRGLNLRLR